MANIYAVIAKTTKYETVVDSVWENPEWANNRVKIISSNPEIFFADVREMELNGVDSELDYELEDHWEDWDDDGD